MQGSPTRIGLISDTHGLLRPQALEALRGSELILHAGDVGQHGMRVFQLHREAGAGENLHDRAENLEGCLFGGTGLATFERLLDWNRPLAWIVRQLPSFRNYLADPSQLPREIAAAPPPGLSARMLRAWERSRVSFAGSTGPWSASTWRSEAVPCWLR